MSYNNNNYYTNYSNNAYPQQQYQNPTAVNEDELGFDDTIVEDEKEFVLFPKGIYAFEVKQFKKDRTKGNKKNPPCNMVVVEIDVIGPDNQIKSMNSYLVLNRKMEWKLSQFFVAIGQKKKGEPLKMNWAQVPGSKGHLELIETVSSKGNPMNEINRFINPEELMNNQQPQYYQQGSSASTNQTPVQQPHMYNAKKGW